MSDPKVIAVLCADVHLSATPPVWRSNEPDWYAAMARPLKFLHSLCSKYKAPLVIAGDIFDRWNPPPELINWAIRHLRMPHEVYAVPGQHDLPNHRYEDIRKSGYWTLVEAGIIENLDAPMYHGADGKGNGLMLHGFPWKKPITPPDKDLMRGFENFVHLAVVHDYCWSEGHSFPGCEEEKHWKKHAENLEGYDAAVFGDNHKGFLAARRPKCSILNCGSLMRRNSDQADYRPKVGLLRSDGGIELVKVPIDEDKSLGEADAGLKEQADETLSEFIRVLEGLGELVTDFRDVCTKFMRTKRIPDAVQRIVLSCLEQQR